VHGGTRAGLAPAGRLASRAPTRRRSTRRTWAVATAWRSSRASWHSTT